MCLSGKEIQNNRDRCVTDQLAWVFLLQESRRAERAEQQRVRAEKERDRQTRIAVINVKHCAAYVVLIRACQQSAQIAISCSFML